MIVIPDPKKIKIRSKIVDCVFIKYAYNSSAYWFLVHKSCSEDIHHSTIMESINAIFFKDEFSWKKTRENYLFKRMIKASSRDHHQSKDDYDKVELRRSKMTKKTTTYTARSIIESKFITLDKLRKKAEWL